MLRAVRKWFSCNRTYRNRRIAICCSSRPFSWLYKFADWRIFWTIGRLSGQNKRESAPPPADKLSTNTVPWRRVLRVMHTFKSCYSRRQSCTHSTPVNQRSAANDWWLRHVWRLADATWLPGNGRVDHRQQTHLYQQRTCKMTVELTPMPTNQSVTASS